MLSINQLIELYERDKKHNAFSLREYELAKQYYHGDQLPPDVKGELEARQQTPIVENLYKMIVKKILGYKTLSIQEVKVIGRQEEDKPRATILSNLLKAFSQQDGYDKEIIKRDRDLIFGLAVCKLWVHLDENEDYYIELEHVPSDCFLIDCYSQDSNAKDALVFHRGLHLDYAQAKALFPNTTLYTTSSTQATQRVPLIESWVCEGHSNGKKVWNRYFWHKQGGLYRFEQSPLKTGSHPYIIAKYDIDEKNRWYGLFRDIKPLQDYINFAENRMANMMGSLKMFYESDAILNKSEFVTSASLDNSITEVQPGALTSNKLHFVQHHSDVSALSQKVSEKIALAKIISGLNDEALGMAVNRQSGVAIAQRRDAGIMGLQDFIKIGDDMDKLIFQKAIDLMVHYFDKKQVFRIVDKKRAQKFFEINTNEKNTLKVGRYDLVYKTQLKTEGREERFAHWSEILKTIASVRSDLLPDLLPLMLRDVNSPIIDDLEEVLEAKNKALQEQAEAQAKSTQVAQELEIEKQKAQVLKLTSESQKLQSQSAVLNQTQKSMQQESSQQTTGNATKAAKKMLQTSTKDMR